MITQPEDMQIGNMIIDSVKKRLEDWSEEELEKMIKEYEKRLRARIDKELAEVALGVSKYVSFETFANQVVISVRKDGLQ